MRCWEKGRRRGKGGDRYGAERQLLGLKFVARRQSRAAVPPSDDILDLDLAGTPLDPFFLLSDPIAPTPMSASSIPSTSARYQTYEARLPLHSNPSSRALLETVIRKRSNLSVSVDVTTKKELLEIVEAVGEFVVCVKVRLLAPLLLLGQPGGRARARISALTSCCHPYPSLDALRHRRRLGPGPRRPADGAQQEARLPDL